MFDKCTEEVHLTPRRPPYAPGAKLPTYTHYLPYRPTLSCFTLLLTIFKTFWFPIGRNVKFQSRWDCPPINSKQQLICGLVYCYCLALFEWTQGFFYGWEAYMKFHMCPRMYRRARPPGFEKKEMNDHPQQPTVTNPTTDIAKPQRSDVNWYVSTLVRTHSCLWCWDLPR